MNCFANLKFLFATAVLALAMGATPARAGVVVSQLGADDGLGIGVLSGEAFFVGDLPLGDGLGEWHAGGSIAELTSNWSGQLLSARLDIFSGGWGLGGQAAVYLNGALIGLLTDGDLVNRGDNYATLDSFDLSGLPSLLQARNNIEIRPRSDDDDGVLGFLRLTLQTQDAGGNAVPEPGSVGLASIALAGALLTRRRRRD